MDPKAMAQEIVLLEKSMMEKARNLEFEEAGRLRDQMLELRKMLIKLG